jgi:hypothetical protein
MVYILVVLTLRSILAHSDGLSSYLSAVFEKDPSSAMNELVKMPSKTCRVTRDLMIRARRDVLFKYIGVLCTYALSIVWSGTSELWGAIWKDNKRVGNEVGEGTKGTKSHWGTRV